MTYSSNGRPSGSYAPYNVAIYSNQDRRRYSDEELKGKLNSLMGLIPGAMIERHPVQE